MQKRHFEPEKNQEATSSAKWRKVDYGNVQTSAAKMAKLKLAHDDYTVGWICPLEVEQIAALEILDEEHERLSQPPTDHNVYSGG